MVIFWIIIGIVGIVFLSFVGWLVYDCICSGEDDDRFGEEERGESEVDVERGEGRETKEEWEEMVIQGLARLGRVVTSGSS